MHEKYSEEYLHILKRYNSYSEDDETQLDFSYQEASAPELVRLREVYNLDNVAGDGDELSRIMNLFDWLQANIIHDGSKDFKGERNAMAILVASMKEKQGVNCRMVATAMNDVFLSMGFKSRFITCLPMGYDSRECHVVNTVYSKAMDKWLFLDPSLGAYFKNRQQEILSLEELREAIISGESIVLNDISHDGKPVTQEAYLQYMTKNLFRMACYNRSEYNHESKKIARVYYFLNPLEFAPRNKVIKVKYNGTLREEYYMTNASQFFKKPE